MKRRHPFYRTHCVANWLAGLAAWEWLSVVCSWTASICLVAATLLLGLVDLGDPKGQFGWWPDLKALLGWLYEARFAAFSLLVCTQFVASALTWLLRHYKRYDAKRLKSVLDAIEITYFSDPDPGLHHYRVTLFKVRHLSWMPFFGMWLGIVARSGQNYPNKTTIFSIDPRKMANNTGIAGECWRQKGNTIRRLLPDVRCENVDQSAVDGYHSTGFVTEAEFRRMNVHSRYFEATGIKVQGRLWGILVIDTTDENQDGRRRGQLLDLAVESITQLVS